MELHRLEIVHGGTLAIKTSHYKICHKRGKHTKHSSYGYAED